MNNSNYYKVITIPNIISVFRLLLVPFIIVLCAQGNTYFAIALVAISGLSDIIDGIIARKFNMISRIGKVIDPFADKVTQCSLIVCLVVIFNNTEFVEKRREMLPVLLLFLGFFLAKEITQFIFGFFAYKRVGDVNSSKWYGKLSTVLLYVFMGILILFNDKIDTLIAVIMLAICVIFHTIALVMYVKSFIQSAKSKV